ncbi:hypothetical protein AAC387_Pa04g2623 [Persea americana]
MDRRLYEAALAGSATSLLELLQKDALVLDWVLVTSVPDTPLHIAAILGHIDFAREILTRKREFAFALNSQGFSPLHLAAAKGYIEIVNELLKADSSGGICLVRDGDGRTSSCRCHQRTLNCPAEAPSSQTRSGSCKDRSRRDDPTPERKT